MTAAASARRPHRFGILTFPVAPSSAVASEWRWAEQLGFDHAWLPDSFSNPGNADFEAWTLLAALAKTTSRIRLGTLVATIIPRHPLLLAAQALTVDELSGGRVEIGVGVGDPAGPENDLFGLPQWSPAERVARLGEQLALLDELLRRSDVTRAGTYYSVTGARLAAPVQRPRLPLVIPAEGPRALRLAARYADAWVTLAGRFGDARPGGAGERATDAEALAKTKARVEELERLTVELGRPPGAIRRMVLSYRQSVDPLTSLDAFDQFVGSYAEAGIDEFVFYWPPVANLKERRPVQAEQRIVVERIAASRLGSGSHASSPMRQ